MAFDSAPHPDWTGHPQDGGAFEGMREGMQPEPAIVPPGNVYSVGPSDAELSETHDGVLPVDVATAELQGGGVDKTPLEEPAHAAGHVGVASVVSKETVSESTDISDDSADTADAAGAEAVSDEGRASDVQTDEPPAEPVAAGGGDIPRDPPKDPPPSGGETPERSDGQNEPESPINLSDAHIKKIARGINRKVYFVSKIIKDGALPATSDSDKLIGNIVRTSENIAAMEQEGSEIRRGLATFTDSRQPQDVFTAQEQSDRISNAMLAGTEKLDLVDLTLATKALDIMTARLVGELPRRDRVVGEQRIREVMDGCRRDLVHAVAPENLVGSGIIDLDKVHEKIYDESPNAMADWMRQNFNLTKLYISDRLTIADMVVSGELWDQGEPEVRSDYAQEPKPGELDKLNDYAADTVERLHLLKAYGVTPFEVSSEKTRLPWDIAVVPPIDLQDDGESRYAEGAVADFVFLDPADEQRDVRFRFDTEGNATHVSMGDSQALLRLRLHDNGQISHGTVYHKIPNNHAEQAFTENYAGTAFQRLRGLLISFAFDALVPDEAKSPAVKSVAVAMPERPEQPSGQRITDMLLRRSRALKEAGVTARRPFPEGWQAPRTDVSGYLRRLPDGARPRPTAEAEAGEYYNSLNVAFDGLPSGYTFTNAYQRGSELRPVTHRRARFRRTSNTAGYLRNLPRRRNR